LGIAKLKRGKKTEGVHQTLPTKGGSSSSEGGVRLEGL